MPVAGMMTPVRRETYQKLQLNAGAFLLNFDYDQYTDADALRVAALAAIQEGTTILGATRGGGSFVVTQEIRDPEIDGVRYRFKGGSFVDRTDASMTGTLVEVTPQNFKYVLATGEAETNGQKTTVRMHTRIKDEDYLENLVWIGDMADGGLVLIALKNALNTSGMNLTFTDKGEGTIPFEFHAYQDSVEDYDMAPFETIFLKPAVTTGATETTETTETTTTTTTTEEPSGGGG